MKKRFKQTLLYAGAVVLLFLVSTAQAQPTDEDRGKLRNRKGRIMAELVEELDLTEEQQAALKEKRTTHRSQVKEIRQTLKTKRKELKDELDKPNSDEGKINRLILEIKGLQGKQVDQRVESVLQTKEILTPEQFLKLRSMQEKRKEKQRGRHRQRRKGLFERFKGRWSQE